VAPSTGATGQNGVGGGGNNGIPPVEEDVDVMSTSTASFRSRSEEGNDVVHETAGTLVSLSELMLRSARRSAEFVGSGSTRR
jgi:hypothetical protein